MAFPTTSILDDFTRANSGSLGANWTDAFEGSPTSGWQIISNQAAQDDTAFFESSYWSASTFGPNLEAYCTLRYNITTTTRLEVWGRITSPGASNNAYIFRLGRSADATAFGWEKNVAGVNSAIGADIVHAAGATGDRVGIELNGTSLQAYYDTGSGWTALGSGYTDSSLTGAGNIGMRGRSTAVIDDFGGGNILTFAPSVNPDYSKHPKFILAGRSPV